MLGLNAQTIEPVRTSITVLEKIEAETPAYVTTLNRTAVEQQPGLTLDDRLRAIPGFSLFRRSSSLAANPTTQGVSLRGLGSSGASRSLVLWDGVPINDPFGGWVYWTRVAPEELERVEISRGASTSVFGDRAMSGAITLFSRPAQPWRATAAFEAGNRDTYSFDGGLSHLWSKFAVSGHVRALTTDGYYIVREDRRGPVDTPANVRFVAGDTRLDLLGAAQRLFVRLDVLAEERANGTSLTYNSTSVGTVAGSYSREWPVDTLSLLAYHTREEYRASFSAVAADRRTERLTSLQTVPSEALGAAAMWHHRGGDWNLLGGADTQRVEGTSIDRPLPADVRSFNGGSQLQHGTFLQSDMGRGPLKVFAGLRHSSTGTGVRFLSPNAGVTAGRGRWRGRFSTYRSFRAPTLNELYRPFRVGNAETRANSSLRPEKLFGLEAGADFMGENIRITLGIFRNKLDDVITNVTLQSAPTLIVRQRRNAAEAISRGVDLNARWSWRHWSADLGYLFAESRFSTGERIPQVPKHAGSAQLTWAREGTLISAGVRAYSLQFEDDRNQFVLPGFATLQLAARHRIAGHLFAIAAVENLSDREFLVGYTPVPLIGTPRMWRVGLRWDGPLRLTQP